MGRSWEKWFMIKLRFLLFSLLTLFTSNITLAQSAGKLIDGTIASGVYAPRNYVKNPSGFKNTLGITVSSATIARDTDTADKLDGIASLVCDASSQNGYYLWSLDTIQEGDKTGNCEFKVTYKGDASLYKLRITDTSSTLTDSSVLSNVTDWTEASINYPCGSSRDVRLVQTESGTGAAVNVGRVYYGKATNIGSTGYVGPWTSWTPTGSLTTNTTYTGKYRINGDMKEYEVKVAFSGTNTEGVLTINLPSGDVIDTAKISAGTDARTFNNSSTEIFDSGTDSYDGKVRYNSTTAVTPLVSRDDQGTSTAYIDFAQINTSTGVPITIASGDYIIAKWSVPIVGLGSNTSVSVSTNPFFTEWTSYTPTITNGGTTSTNSGYCRRVADSLECNLLTIYTGAGSASPLRYKLPTTMCNGGQCTIDTAKIHTSAREGGVLWYDASVTTEKNAAVYYFDTDEVSINGHGVTTGAAMNGSELASGDYIRLNFKVPIVGWTAPQSVVPILVGSVSSNSTGAERIERVKVASTCTSNPCTIAYQSGSWVSSITRTATGGYELNIPIGLFSSAPACTCSASDASTPYTVCDNKADITTTTKVTLRTSTGGALADAAFDVICMGPR